MKKSQIQLGESTTIIIVVIIMIVIGFSFYAYLKADNIRKDQELMQEYQDIQLILIASNVPELLCSHKGVLSYNCYDVLKIRALDSVIEKSRKNDQEALFYYQDLFGTSEVNVTVIYPTDPTDPTEEHYVVFNQSSTEFESFTTKYIPTIVYDPINDINKFGLVTIRRYFR